jgi:tRNA A-37 threonylcarbamoyl transferase component Bud32
VERELEIFGELVDRAPADRDAILERAGREDPALRTRLEALLAAYESAGSFLESPPAGLAAPLPDEKPGDVIGRYTLIRKIGEGGCGTVYLAEQKIPVRRRVALKVIKLGMDTRSVIARFEGERQALALMDHPDIARVLDAGATDAGRPYFVMEFVDGVPLARFCDERSLALRARLELFARVCLALQHAHQKGIIHRDVKPSNILVTEVDGVPCPKVIDFGIAKATQERLTEHTQLTGVDHFIGTPAYMSPEQADLRDLDIDTRSDIYALGVVLYELLAGRLPFDPKSLQHAGVEEIRRIIRESQPPRPSARLAALPPAERATVAHLRGTAPAALAATLRGDLDWIAIRCLEKDRARRYGSAQELADDVRRHLRSEPVAARPPTATYRTRRFVARHRLACASAAAIAVSLVAGIVVSVRQAVRATAAEHIATAERDAANTARADAQRRQRDAESLLSFVNGDFRAELNKIGQIKLLEPVDRKIAGYFSGLDPRDLTDTALAQHAKALYQIGATRMEEARFDDAESAFRTSHERAAALAARHPRNADHLFERAQAEYWLGFVARKRGNLSAAREWWARYRDSAVALARLEPDAVRARRELGWGAQGLAIIDLELDDIAGARAGFLAAKSAQESLLAEKPGDADLRYSVAESVSWLARIAESDGDYPEALARYVDYSTRMDQLAAAQPAVSRWKLRQATTEMLIAKILALQGKRAEATAAFGRSHVKFAQLVALDPKNRQTEIQRVTAQVEELPLRLSADDQTGLDALLDETRGGLEKLLEAEPASRLCARMLAAVWRLKARRLETSRPGEALAAAAQAIERGEKIVSEGRADNAALGEAAQARILAGRLAAASGQLDAARAHWQLVVESLTPRLAATRDWRLLDPAAQALLLLGRRDEAEPLALQLRRFSYHPADFRVAAEFQSLSSLSGEITTTQPANRK